MLTIDQLDIVIDTLEGLYPGKFAEFSTATMHLWQKELGDVALDTVLAAVRRWAMQHHHTYAPTLTSLLTLVDEVRQDDHRELARARQANAAWQAAPAGDVLAQAAAAYVGGAKDSVTALYGQLMGQLAQRSLAEKLTADDLAAQCQCWAGEYPPAATLLRQAAAQFGGAAAGVGR